MRETPLLICQTGKVDVFNKTNQTKIHLQKWQKFFCSSDTSSSLTPAMMFLFLRQKLS